MKFYLSGGKKNKINCLGSCLTSIVLSRDTNLVEKCPMLRMNEIRKHFESVGYQLLIFGKLLPFENLQSTNLNMLISFISLVIILFQI